MDPLAFVRAHTRPAPAAFVPELSLRLADDAIALWERTEQETHAQLAPPFWAFAWAGGQALARYLLDHPDEVAGRTVLDLAAGGGIVAIAAARAGAARVTATEVDPLAVAALTLNAAANGVEVLVSLHDVLDTEPPGVDLITAGDVFYSRDLATRMLSFLDRAARRGARVLVGDPGRAYLPRTRLTPLVTYRVPTPHTLENAEVKTTIVSELRMVERSSRSAVARPDASDNGGMTQTVTLPGAPAGTQAIELPVVGFGTWQLRGAAAYTAVRYALEVGYRHLDTATMYGNEAEVGRAVRDSGLARDEVFITTKLQPDRASRARETLAASLSALGTDFVDLWLVHWPPREGASAGLWREFLAARAAGQVRAVGVSNYSIAQLDELITATAEAPAVNQVPWSPTEHDPAHLTASRERGVLVEGYSPLKRSDLRDPVLGSVAERHGVTVPQVILRWHLEHGIPVIPKSARKDRIEANFDLFGFALDADDVAGIDALSRQ